jgi:hypothetical protein
MSDNDATRRDNLTRQVSLSVAAERLGVSVRTVQRRLKRGDFEFVERDGERFVVLPESATSDATARQSDATGDATSVAGDVALLAEREARIAELREEVLFLRERNRELNAIVMRHAHALPAPQSPTMLEAPEPTTTRPAPASAQKPARPLWMVLLGWRPRR